MKVFASYIISNFIRRALFQTDDTTDHWYFYKGYQSGALRWFLLELRNRSVLAIYNLIWEGMYPYSFFKNHQYTTNVYDSKPAKSPTQFSTLLSICSNMSF